RDLALTRVPAYLEGEAAADGELVGVPFGKGEIDLEAARVVERRDDDVGGEPGALADPAGAEDAAEGGADARLAELHRDLAHLGFERRELGAGDVDLVGAHRARAGVLLAPLEDAARQIALHLQARVARREVGSVHLVEDLALLDRGAFLGVDADEAP